MWTTFIHYVITAAHTVHEWLPELITTLRFGTATIGFSIAVHRAFRYWRSDRER